MKGRPPTRGKIGALPHYSDRLAVKCAALKNTGITYSNIGEQIKSELADVQVVQGNQADIAQYLVGRGKSY